MATLTLDDLLARRFPELVALPEEALFADRDALSSWRTLELIQTLEETYGLRIPDEDLDDSTLGSKARLRAYLTQRLGETP